MLPWKTLLVAVPAGLLLGLVAGQASRPVMLVKDDRPWPQSVSEDEPETDRWPTFDIGAPEAIARGYSYRPDINYDIYAWPDQTDRSAEMFAADYDYGAAGNVHETRLGPETDLPLTRRAVAEPTGRQGEALAAEIVDMASEEPRPANLATAPELAGGDEGAFILPPVPPPLAPDGTATGQAPASESAAF